ncbi:MULTISPECIES: cyclic nucleotide-binding domain-containing protein [unclassified Bradyrhizobium]|uniref:Crp/Fnr family transcriptional regulator n=1 Tax=unclassified Bradyrhizobium TaxID=2631580 RepID=UPI001FF8DB3C|nr:MULTISPECIES: cyclic nucleotide-binding domain-containing protein [unclassified Bradyrhizobium]
MVALDQDAVLSRAGEPIEYVFFPHGGAISLMIDMADGQTVATAAVGRKGAVGMLSVLGPSPSAATAVVHAAGTAARISASRFHAAFNRSPAIRNLVQNHVRAMLIQFQLGSACNALHRSKPAWLAGYSSFATASTTTYSRSPSRRFRKYSVYDERR